MRFGKPTQHNAPIPTIPPILPLQAPIFRPNKMSNGA